MPKVSILMLNWNTSIHTLECLKSLDKQSFKDFEIILIDNGSTIEDYTKVKNGLKRIESNVVLKRLGKNSGITGGMNFAYKFSKGNYIIFMNNDMIATKNFLSEILAPFSRHENVGAVVPKGGYMVVEDTNINGHPVNPIYGPGPMEAVEDFLKERDDFVIDLSRERLMLTFFPNGFLKRVK